MTTSKNYRTEVRTDSDYDEIPSAAVFTIEQATAQRILKLSALVKDHGLYKVEEFDYRTVFLKSDAEDEIDDDDQASTEADCLNVSEQEFWFSAIIKHTNVEIVTARQSIAELAAHFGLPIDGRERKLSAESESAMDEIGVRSAECLAFLRSASAVMTLARSARVHSALPSDIQDEILNLSKQVDAMVTTVWDTIGGDRYNEQPVKETAEVFEGYLSHAGMRIEASFTAPIGDSVKMKDAAFMAALAQQAELNYLSVGTTEGRLTPA